MSEQAKKSHLAAAAEALIEAASLEVDSLTQKKLAHNLDSLKTSFDSNLNKVVQKMESSNQNFDAKVNTLNQNVASVKSEIVALRSECAVLKALMEDECKQKTLERARGLVHLGSFTYYLNSGMYRESKNSSELAKCAIEWFMLGYGYNLPDAVLIHNSYSEKIDERRKEFREKFTAQLKDLIKREPRLKVNTSGTYSIHYS